MNKDKYNKVFFQVFEAKLEELDGLKYKGIYLWDSVGQISLISALEKEFNITINPEDIRGLNSYLKGLEILNNKYNIQF
jgi:acyl carrier protein